MWAIGLTSDTNWYAIARSRNQINHQYDMQQKKLQLAKQRQKVQDPEADLAAQQETVPEILIQYRT